MAFDGYVEQEMPEGSHALIGTVMEEISGARVGSGVWRVVGREGGGKTIYPGHMCQSAAVSRTAKNAPCAQHAPALQLVEQPNPRQDVARRSSVNYIAGVGALCLFSICFGDVLRLR